MNLWIKPGILVRATKDHGHALMDLAHELVGCGGQYRKRRAFMRRAGLPCLPNARNAHDELVTEMDSEWAFSLAVRLPLEKSAYGYDAPLADYQVSIKFAREHRLASHIDRRQFRFERWFVLGDQLPVHLIELSLSGNQSQHW